MKTFSERVVAIALSVPKGRVTTYGRIARAAGGGAMSAQSITNILGKACLPCTRRHGRQAYDVGVTDIPFHRIVYADGSIWISERRRKERLALYKKEGILIDAKDRVKNFQKVLFDFK